MPTQSEYFDAIGRAGLTVADEALALVNSEKAGCPTDWTEVFCEVQKICCAQFFYANGDYVSDDSLTFYNAMLSIAGTNYSNAQPDPNAQPINGGDIIINESGAEVESYAYTQASLIDADPPNGAWYLPFETPDGNSLSGKTPIMVAINGTSFTFQFDNLTQRIYGFANNDTQTITLTVI